jgi:hypothetical protein
MPRRIPASGSTRWRAGVLTAIITAGLCAGGTSASAAAPADLDPPDVLNGELSTPEVVVTAVGTAKIEVRAHLSDPQGVANGFVTAVPDDFLDFLVGAIDTGKDPGDLDALLPAPAPLRLIAGTVQDGTWAGTIRVKRTNLPGSYTVGLIAMDRSHNIASSSELGHFQARFRTALRADISPATVDQGDVVTVSGRLGRVAPAGWAPFAHRPVEVQFRPAGSPGWHTRGILMTGADGRFANSTRFHAKRDGAWRIRFNGGSKYAPGTSAADVVTTS